MVKSVLMMSKTDAFTLDSLAIRLAADMGQAWQDLCSFPGYARNIWRDEARRKLLRETPGVIFEIVPCPWDETDIEYIVRTPAGAA